ncbi:MAG: SPFH domain-containing protein, partial [Psychromonas sp.]
MAIGNEPEDPGSPWDQDNRTVQYNLLMKSGFSRFKNKFPSGHPGGGGRFLFFLICLALLGISLWSAIYTIPSDSVAVVQRFGKYLKEVPPGLHFKIPFGIDLATIVPVKRQLKQEFGFIT